MARPERWLNVFVQVRSGCPDLDQGAGRGSCRGLRPMSAHYFRRQKCEPAARCSTTDSAPSSCCAAATRSRSFRSGCTVSRMRRRRSARSQAMYWHSHEMLYGFVMAAVAGFLLTAVPSWTGARGFAGRPLMFVVALWVLGRIGDEHRGRRPVLADRRGGTRVAPGAADACWRRRFFAAPTAMRRCWLSSPCCGSSMRAFLSRSSAATRRSPAAPCGSRSISC